MGFDESKVSILRLVSGEEIIACVTKTESSYLLDTPFQVAVQPDGSGKPNVLMAPFLFLKDEDEPFEAPKEIVAFGYKANQNVAAKYKELYYKVNSNLILPPTSGRVSLAKK